MGEEDDGTDIAHTDVNPRLTFINREGGSCREGHHKLNLFFLPSPPHRFISFALFRSGFVSHQSMPYIKMKVKFYEKI